MNTMENGHIRTTWIAVSLLLTTIVGGYVLLIIFRDGQAALAQPVRCPVEEACLKGECNCQHGLCNADCPGNCTRRVTE
jgi:hypothetical protein